MLRSVLFLHRWLGIVIGLLMTIWCLSGFVMMYVDYPALTPAEQVRGLAPLKLPAPAAVEGLDLPGDTPLSSARVEMMAGRPVLRIVPDRTSGQMRAAPGVIDLATGQPIEGVGAADVAAIASTFGTQSGVAGGVSGVAETEMDQWTVQTYRRNAPLYRADYADARGTQAYISGQSGEIVQDTTRFERFWGWLGAVPHWLYPTILRQDGALWTQVVIWTSLVGCFLTATGMWVGIARLRRKRDGSIGSPYRGLWWWHHVFGLFFGLLTLTWVASGLLSMNPWDVLASEAGPTERTSLAGPMHWRDVSAALAHVGTLPADTVRLETAPLGGRVFLAAINAKGEATRLDGAGRPAPLDRSDVTAALHWAPGVASLELLQHEDAYYYAHKQPVALPVWRAILADSERTRLYIDATTGRLLRAYDSNGRIYRWAMHGLHSLDLPILRSRPVWDLVVVPLLALVTLVCATGTWMGVDKVRRDLRRARNRRNRRAAALTRANA
ncbi:MAG TPA: PepSY domain-containing protein [Sphingobium sp.]|nr:PepSY domain-containing protein [Sphingobium sp.]